MTQTFRMHLAVLGLALPIATAALAAGEVDGNGDGLLTIDEVQSAYPEIDADAFTAMDVNADGSLDADEVTAAQQAGLMPKTDG